MREGTSKHLALLAVELYEITDQFIYELREKQHDSQDVFNYLPEFTINRNENANNRPIVAKYYHQFVGAFKPDKVEKYLYFNLRSNDALLAEELAQGGVDDLFEEIDFEKMLSKFTPQQGDDITKFVFPKTNYLIVELTYVTSVDHFSGGYDCDMTIEIVGYLDNQLQRNPFKTPVRSTNLFERGDKVLLPFEERGRVLEYLDRPWASRYNVKITESNGFNEVGEIHDFFEHQLQLDKK